MLQAACGQIAGLGGVDFRLQVRIVEGGREDADFAPGVGYFRFAQAQLLACAQCQQTGQCRIVALRFGLLQASLQRGVQRLFLFCQQAGLGAQQQRVQPFVRLQCCAVLLQKLLGLPGDADRVPFQIEACPCGVESGAGHGQRQHQA